MLEFIVSIDINDLWEVVGFSRCTVHNIPSLLYSRAENFYLCKGIVLSNLAAIEHRCYRSLRWVKLIWCKYVNRI